MSNQKHSFSRGCSAYTWASPVTALVLGFLGLLLALCSMYVDRGMLVAGVGMACALLAVGLGVIVFQKSDGRTGGAAKGSLVCGCIALSAVVGAMAYLLTLGPAESGYAGTCATCGSELPGDEKGTEVVSAAVSSEKTAGTEQEEEQEEIFLDIAPVPHHRTVAGPESEEG